MANKDCKRTIRIKLLFCICIMHDIYDIYVVYAIYNIVLFLFLFSCSDFLSSSFFFSHSFFFSFCFESTESVDLSCLTTNAHNCFCFLFFFCFFVCFLLFCFVLP